MQIRINLYAIPRSFQILSKDELAEFKSFLEAAIDEQLQINPINEAVFKFLPFSGAVKVTIHWCVNTTSTEKFLPELNWGDIDNVAKPIIDALQKKVFVNDRQVVELNLMKHSLKDFDLSKKPVNKITYTNFAAKKAISNETDYLFIEVSDVEFHV